MYGVLVWQELSDYQKWGCSGGRSYRTKWLVNIFQVIWVINHGAAFDGALYGSISHYFRIQIAVDVLWYLQTKAQERIRIRVNLLEYTRVSSESYPDAPCVEYLPTFGWFLLIFGVNVGKYSIHGAYGIATHLQKTHTSSRSPRFRRGVWRGITERRTKWRLQARPKRRQPVV